MSALVGKWQYDLNYGGAHFSRTQSLDNLIQEFIIIHVLCRKMILQCLFLMKLGSKQ
jgi:hypothetical protein